MTLEDMQKLKLERILGTGNREMGQVPCPTPSLLIIEERNSRGMLALA